MTKKEITLEDLNYFWMPNGAPCFIADRDDICDIVENIGFSIYYIISNNMKVTVSTSTSYTPGGTGPNKTTPNTVKTETITKNAKMFKVVSNFIGRAISISEDPLPDNFVSVEENCLYNLPGIPFELTDKLDQFFRLVHAKHGTESIVLLTFDPSKEDSSGWGILVPEQTNTAAHCSYDAESVIAIKPDNVYIVGSVHSHPEMPAYASGTDHADQADFDGIHITYGWQKSVNNGSTQYYAELQLGGSNYKMDIEDIFESYTINKDPDPEVVAWSDKVKKAFPPSGGGHRSLATQTTAQAQQATNTGADTDPGSRRKIQFYKDNVIHLNIEPDSIIVAEVYVSADGTAICPSCDFDLDDGDFYAGYCSICDIPVAVESSSMNLIGRNVLNYCKSRSLSYDAPSYLWGTDENNIEFLIKLNLDKALSNEFYDDDDYQYVTLDASLEQAEYYEDFSKEYMVCCGERADQKPTACTCNIPVFFEDYQQFDKATASMSVYTLGSQCYSCQYFYAPGCPRLVELMQAFVEDNYDTDSIASRFGIDGCENFLSYRSEMTDSDYIDERYYS
jgi:hypothetical protein